jgi:hypothetical protein
MSEPWRGWKVFALAAPAIFMVSLDGTVIVAAFPALLAQLFVILARKSLGDDQWLHHRVCGTAGAFWTIGGS